MDMAMLTKDDLRQIGEVVDERLDKKLDEKFLKFEDRIVNRIIGDVGEMLEQNVLTEIEKVRVGLEDVKTDVAGLKKDVTAIKATMVTKEYLDEKLGGTRGDLIAYDRRLEAKTDTLVGALERNKTLAPADIAVLETARVFPKRPAA